MMRWNKGDTGFEVKANDSDVVATGNDRIGPGAILDHVIAALAATLVRAGVTSTVVAVTMAILIATVLFGLFSGDASALGQWCRKC